MINGSRAAAMPVRYLNAMVQKVLCYFLRSICHVPFLESFRDRYGCLSRHYVGWKRYRGAEFLREMLYECHGAHGFSPDGSRIYLDRGDGMAGQDERKPEAPSKEAAAVNRHCDLRHRGPHADALYLFRGDRVWQCRYGDCRALQLSCHGHLLQCHPPSQAAIKRGGHHGLSGCRRYLSSCDRR